MSTDAEGAARASRRQGSRSDPLAPRLRCHQSHRQRRSGRQVQPAALSLSPGSG